MKTSMYILFFMLSSISILSAQEFKTTIVAESNGRLDSVVIGFDYTASIYVDTQFGESDTQGTPFDSTGFELRAGQINHDIMDCGINSINDDEMVFYMSKIDITHRNCEGWDYNEIISGARPYSTLFIRNKDLPVSLKWDASVLENECLEGSIMLDWHPWGWLHISCPTVSFSPPVHMATQSTFLITNPSGMSLIDTHGDTLSMFFVTLGDGDLINSTQNILQEKINVYPNPTTDVIHISSVLDNQKKENQTNEKANPQKQRVLSHTLFF